MDCHDTIGTTKQDDSRCVSASHPPHCIDVGSLRNEKLGLLAALHCVCSDVEWSGLGLPKGRME
jgi:hypothetical protein